MLVRPEQGRYPGSMFLQDPPNRPDRWLTDATLRDTLERILPADVFAEAEPELAALGQRSGELSALAERAEANPPRLTTYDGWGQRVDRIDVDPSWLQLVEIGQRIGVVAVPYESRFGAHARVVQFGLLDLYNGVSATGDCPLSMTDAAARVLLTEDPELAQRYVPRLSARTDAWTSGQWMTETAGGSDVGRTATTARDLGDGTFALHGVKWFTSATTADIALALARPEGAEEGSRGLSLFLLRLRNDDGTWNGISVRKLKDKLGTKALPTAELELDGTVAVPVGGLGRGVAKIATMLNITRLHVASGSHAGMGEGLALARDYATRREASGAPLRSLPAHRAWMAQIAALYEAGTALAFRASELLGRVEHRGGDDELARIVFPLAKLALARQGVTVTSQLIESFGGAGYVEDTGLPRMLRDAHVQCIWEGTTSVIALDALRALARPGVAEAFSADVERAAASGGDQQLLEGPRHAVRAALDELKKIEPTQDNARRLAWGMARTYEAALLCEHAAWSIQNGRGARAATAAAVFTSEPLVGLDPGVGPEALDELAFG